VELEELGKLEKKKTNDIIGTRTRDLPAYSITSTKEAAPIFAKINAF
jgi:hypothetical protein